MPLAICGICAGGTPCECDDVARRGRPEKQQYERKQWRDVGMPGWIYHYLEIRHPGLTVGDALVRELFPELFSENNSPGGCGVPGDRDNIPNET